MKLSSIFAVLWGCVVGIVLESLIPNLEFLTLWQYWVLLIIPIVMVTLSKLK